MEKFIEDDDGVRVRPPSMERWWQVHQCFLTVLEAMEVPVGLRMGQGCLDLDERVDLILQRVEKTAEPT